MATRSLWRTRTKLAVAATALCGGWAAATVSTSDDPATALKLCTAVPLRLVRDSVTAASIAFDYEYSLFGLPEGSSERAQVKHEVHLRSARKLQELCFRNGGIYIKLGQHIGQLEYLVPQEYVQIMRESMLNKCPVSSYDQVCEVFKKELGETPDQEPVVVVDFFSCNSNMCSLNFMKCFVIQSSVTCVCVFTFGYQELDFLLEAKNSEKVMENFWKLSPHIANYIYSPRVHWNLSTSKLLTMEFMDGAQVNDVKTIRKLGIQPHEVARLVSQAFAEMIFKHGFVHCDPHAANLLVRPIGHLAERVY
ncbi:hypothetical protein Patl1_06597 [Pistacia atlantica]|uniref:Uncharacterized protein n=1 Tax=Pistacia atlantica TaxID=434234 RepID=A0ACC1BUL6_9ROSI|nr:hypothetical protein Patl1_06597 [Pistacia atlantica]